MTDEEPTCSCLICRGHGDELDAVDRTTIEHVEQHGWSVLQIPEDDLGPGWAFTVGLWHSRRQPELAIFGLEVGAMKACLNVLGEQSAAGCPPEPEEVRSHILDGSPVLFKVVDRLWSKAFFGTAAAFYRRSPVPFLQVLWADEDERFPTAPDRQPSLWLRPDEHPPGVWTQDL